MNLKDFGFVWTDEPLFFQYGVTLAKKMDSFPKKANKKD